MISNIDQFKKKIIYRSNYRGTKEMDKLLGAFTKKYIDKLNDYDLIDLEKLAFFATNVEFFERRIICIKGSEKSNSSSSAILKLKTEL